MAADAAGGARAARPSILRFAGDGLLSRIVAGALAGALAVGCGRAADDELLVVVVSLDTTRPDHLSAYGYGRPTTPTLEKLAREGTLFTQARATTSWTLPSHMSLFTGLPPGLHGVVADFDVLDRGHRTLGEIFQTAGFRTEGLYTAPYVHPRFGFGRGMDLYERATLEPMLFDLTPEQQRAQVGRTEQQSHREVTSERLVDRALALLDEGRAPRRLLFLHFFDPHYDYRPPARLARLFTDPDYRGPVSGDAVTDNPALHAGLPAADLAELEGLYDAELAWTDENLGRLVAALEAGDRREHTLLVVVGDHGEEFFEHGAFGHRAGLHDEVLRVPLLLWAPGRVPAGRRIDAEVGTCDVLPTLMDYAGLPADPVLWGRSLRPLVDGAATPSRGVSAALSWFPHDDTGSYVLFQSFVHDGLKVLQSVPVSWSAQSERDLAGTADTARLRRQVFDVRADPGEQHDLAGSHDPRVASAIEAFERDTAEQAAVLQRFVPEGDGETPPLELNLRETLEALGYTGAATSPGAASSR